MTGIEHQPHTKETDVERNTEDIRNDISKKEDNIQQTVEQIGERIKEKLDWREYVKASPYWALGTAAGLGCLASRSPKRPIRGSITDEARNSFGPGKAILISLGIGAGLGYFLGASSRFSRIRKV